MEICIWFVSLLGNDHFVVSEKYLVLFFLSFSNYRLVYSVIVEAWTITRRTEYFLKTTIHIKKTFNDVEEVFEYRVKVDRGLKWHSVISTWLYICKDLNQESTITENSFSVLNCYSESYWKGLKLCLIPFCTKDISTASIWQKYTHCLLYCPYCVSQSLKITTNNNYCEFKSRNHAILFPNIWPINRINLTFIYQLTSNSKLHLITKTK